MGLIGLMGLIGPMDFCGFSVLRRQRYGDFFFPAIRKKYEIAVPATFPRYSIMMKNPFFVEKKP